MPSKSPAQAKLMAAAAHTKGGFGGVPQSVGKDFNNKDVTPKRKHIVRALRWGTGGTTQGSAIGGGANSGSGAGGGT